MNLQHLRYFLAVIDLGSVSRAAESLGVTQPTLSVALQRLEHEFGARLFAPDGRGIKPLAGAKILEGKARMALRALSDARRELSGATPAGPKVGLLHSLAGTWAAKLIDTWQGPLEIIEGSADELDKKIANGEIQLALTMREPRKGIHGKALYREPYMLFIGGSHRFSGRRTIELVELDREPFVLRLGCEQLGSGRRLLESLGIRVRVVARTRQESTAATLVAAGVGCTIAPRSWQPGMAAVSVAGFTLERTIALVWKDPLAAATVGQMEARLKPYAAALARMER